MNSHHGGELDGFQYFFPGGAGFYGVMNVVGDAVVAPMCDADCQRHQFFGLPV